MARYDLPDDEAWTLIQPLLPAKFVSPWAGRPRAEHRKIINNMFWCCFPVLRGVIYLNDMDHRKRLIASLTDSQSQVLLTFLSIGYFHYLIPTILLTGLLRRWIKSIRVVFPRKSNEKKHWMGVHKSIVTRASIATLLRYILAA